MKAIKFNKQGITDILNGNKTQTRRPIKPQPTHFDSIRNLPFNEWFGAIDCPFGKAGDTIAAVYQSESDEQSLSIHLKIKDIRVERLQDISEANAIAEGVKTFDLKGHPWYGVDENIGKFVSRIEAFAYIIWEPLLYVRPYNWHSNPWVWVIEFEKKEK